MNVDVRSTFAPADTTLRGKVAVITGSTSGIGLGIARRMAAAGAIIVLNGIETPEAAGAVISAFNAEFGTDVLYSAADMAKPESIGGLVEAALGAHGRIDILVNNAGIQHVSPVDQFPVDKWDAVLAINLTSAFHTTRLALPVMRRSGWGARV